MGLSVTYTSRPLAVLRRHVAHRRNALYQIRAAPIASDVPVVWRGCGNGYHGQDSTAQTIQVSGCFGRILNDEVWVMAIQVCKPTLLRNKETTHIRKGIRLVSEGPQSGVHRITEWR